MQKLWAQADTQELELNPAVTNETSLQANTEASNPQDVEQEVKPMEREPVEETPMFRQ